MRPILPTPEAQAMIDAVAELARAQAVRRAHQHRPPFCDECTEIRAAEQAARERTTRIARGLP